MVPRVADEKHVGVIVFVGRVWEPHQLSVPSSPLELSYSLLGIEAVLLQRRKHVH